LTASWWTCTKLPDEWVRFLAESTANGIPVYHAASIYEAATSRVALNYAHADWLREMFLGSAAYLPVKRALDIVLVLAVSPVVIPLSLVVALLVRLSSPGPSCSGKIAWASADVSLEW